MLQHLRQQARRELLAEGRKHAITAKLRQIPYMGPIRSVLAVALMQTPHRFRTAGGSQQWLSLPRSPVIVKRLPHGGLRLSEQLKESWGAVERPERETVTFSIRIAYRSDNGKSTVAQKQSWQIFSGGVSDEHVQLRVGSGPGFSA